MVQRKKPDILEEQDFEDLEIEAPNNEKSKNFSVSTSTSSSEMMSTLMKIVAPVIGMVLVVGAVILAGWWLTSRDDDSGDDTDTQQSQVVEDDEDEVEEEPVELTEEEKALQFVKFTEIGEDEFRLTGRVTDVYDDRAFDGNAGIIVEGEYKIDTEFGGGGIDSVTVGQVDDVGVGDWVEVFAQGRKSFSSEASYVMDIFDSIYSVKGIENPVTGVAVVGNQVEDTDEEPTDDDDNNEEDNQDDDSDSSDTPINNATGNDPVSIRGAAVESGSSLTLTLSYPGCAAHDFGMNRISIDADPSSRKIVLQVVHDANGDSCERENQSEEFFDISDLIKEFNGDLPYDIEIRGSDESNSVEFTVA